MVGLTQPDPQTLHWQKVGQALNTHHGCQSLPVAVHPMGQRDKSKACSKMQHLLKKKNVQVLFNPESGFKVVVEMGYTAYWECQ